MNFFMNHAKHRIIINKIECFFIFLYEKREKKIRKRQGAAATIAERKTKNEPTINTRRTIEKAFDLVTPANQSLGRLILRCTRSRVPSFALVLPATDQTMPDSGKLSKRPFRKNSICTQMKATN